MISYIDRLVVESTSVLLEKAKAKIAEQKEKKDSNTNGVLHELLLGYHLNGGKHMELHPNDEGESPEEAHDRLKKEIIRKHGRKTYEDMSAKAADAASAIRKKVKKPVNGVYWTSKKGDIERLTGKPTSQDDDASDLYLQHHSKGSKGKKDFTGLSLKTVEKKGASVPVGNPGHGTIDSLLGTNTRHHFEKARENLRKRHPKLAAAKTAGQAKAILKSDKKASQTESEERTKALANIAKDHHAVLSKMSQHELWHHIKRMTRAQVTDNPHLRVTSSGTNGDYAHKFEDPAADHISKWGEEPAPGSKKGHIKVELKGGTIHFTHAQSGARIKQRYKAEGSSGVFGSIKASIE